MRLFFVNVYAKDSGQTRDIPAELAAIKPYRCFIYAVVAQSALDALQYITKHSEDLTSHGWTNLSFAVQNPEGYNSNTPVYSGSCEVSEEDVRAAHYVG